MHYTYCIFQLINVVFATCSSTFFYRFLHFVQFCSSFCYFLQFYAILFIFLHFSAVLCSSVFSYYLALFLQGWLLMKSIEKANQAYQTFFLYKFCFIYPKAGNKNLLPKSVQWVSNYRLIYIHYEHLQLNKSIQTICSN